MLQKAKCRDCGKDAELVLEDGKPKEAFHLFGKHYMWYRCDKCKKRFTVEIEDVPKK